MKRYIIASMGGISSIGGVERVMYYLHEILKKNNNVIIVDKKVITSNFPMLQHIKTDSILIYAIFTSIYIKKIRTKDDVIIGNGYNLPFVRKDVLFAHGNIVAFCRKVYHFTNYKLGFLEMFSAWSSKKILAVSEQTKNEWRKYYRIKKEIAVIGNGVDCKKFFPIEKNSRQDFTILYCGRLEVAKGSRRLLELAKCIEQKSGIKLKMAIPSTTEEMKDFKGLKNTQIYLGKTIDEMNDFYNQGDVFFFPSEYEGFGLVILESLSSGTPVVASRIGVVEELEKKQLPGIVTIDKEDNVEKIIEKIYSLCHEFANICQRNKLHDMINEMYGLEVYKKNIIKIMGLGVD